MTTHNLSPINYESFDGKPSINGHELNGNQTSIQLGLQDDLTTVAGYNANKKQILNNVNGTLTWTNIISGGNAFEV